MNGLTGQPGLIYLGEGAWQGTPSDHTGPNGSPDLSGLHIELPEHAATTEPVPLEMEVYWQDFTAESRSQTPDARSDTVEFTVTIDAQADDTRGRG